MNYTFDPIQFKEFGYLFLKGDNFEIRYQKGRSGIFNLIYVPLGPNCKSFDGFRNAIETFTNKAFTKIIIDLPLILDNQIKDEIKSYLIDKGFKEREYLYQDEETILVRKDNFHCDKKVRWYIKKANESCKTEIKTDLTVGDIKKIYEVYVESANRINYKPKDISTFQRLAENSVVAMTYQKDSVELVSFAFGYIAKLPFDKSSKSLLETIFAGTTITGMKLNAGYSTYYTLIDYTLNIANIDYFDFHGASRSKNRDYTTFKSKFGGEFISLPGSYERLKLF